MSHVEVRHPRLVRAIPVDDPGTYAVNARADITGAVPAPVTRDESRAVFGQVMGFVALTLGFLALGAYIGRDLSGGWGILAFVASFGCIIGLNVASTRGNEQLAISLLFGLGLLLGLALGPVLSSYVEADPAAVWQAAGATGGVRRWGPARPGRPRPGLLSAGSVTC